ncbi:hypothetical protein KJ365_12195 [Glaciecola sp. XM2]|uniref:hypothetical protein n=1 Tax=Glaciecola sp. XM2 TaxID=1914931 RepID=UPI001BDF4DEC|nr:hypothetical protein [Glaciecola sp. XM2]MBT1451643.1 hypothetical protein [Glaciecola sp. XM2]
MNSYIENALETYCDQSQTIIARQIAYSALTNAGFTDQDLQIALESGTDNVPIMLFQA